MRRHSLFFFLGRFINGALKLPCQGQGDWIINSGWEFRRQDYAGVRINYVFILVQILWR
ncbi:hypothetical protein GcC1_c18744o22 [Golovinomyces cichoracearum]|uniref:Uncharacterized protein n=1 Tax=Golovinomyces cichoracearum TaxID=62708 RepID=A0A420IQU1_9PEZI|nr:hypothetical protein GcC1_c18744o22 [Golovinomyces cichoracearum]